MLERQYLAQKVFFGLPECLHIGEALGATKNGCQRDKQNLRQTVPRIVRSRVGHGPKDSFEFPHLTPPVGWESSSESDLLAEATENSFFASARPLASRAEKRCKSRIHQHFSGHPNRRWKAQFQMRFPCPSGEGLRPTPETRITPGGELERQMIMLLRIGDAKAIGHHIEKRYSRQCKPG